MAENDVTTTETDDAQDVMERLRGHDSIIIEDGDGNEYTLRYPRRLVKKMEADGITARSVADGLSAGTLTAVEDFVRTFVMPAFKTDQPKMSFDEVLDIYEQVPEKNDFIQLLIGLYMQPTLALTTDPTETRVKFRLA